MMTKFLKFFSLSVFESISVPVLCHQVICRLLQSCHEFGEEGIFGSL